jgi:hypothetical protein
MVAASAHAVIIGKKVAGIYDHSAGQHLQIAAECRGNRLKGVDGERSAKFGGVLPELYDHGDQAYISLAIEGATARGYDRGSAGFYEAQVTDHVVQLFDHRMSAWFAFDVQVADEPARAAD